MTGLTELYKSFCTSDKTIILSSYSYWHNTQYHDYYKAAWGGE